MKTANQIDSELLMARHRADGYEGVDSLDILYQWAVSIIEECAGNFECTIEECDEEESVIYDMKTGKCIHPVLVKESVLKVKQQL